MTAPSDSVRDAPAGRAEWPDAPEHATLATLTALAGHVAAWQRHGTAVQATLRRAGYAAAAAEAHAVAATLPHTGAEAAEDVLIDVLCDLRHLADALRLDYATLTEVAARLYDREVKQRPL